MQHNITPSPKTPHDRCVYLIFNCKGSWLLSKTERVLVNGITNKWKKKHNDPEGKRIHFIFVDPDDFCPRNTPEAIRRLNKKYNILRFLTANSQLHLIGHHEINDNRLEVMDDGSNHNFKDDVYDYFDVYEIADLLLTYLSHPGTSLSREQLNQTIDDGTNQQKLMITVAMCNTAVGILKNGQRLPENSFACMLASELYNRHPQYFIDCVVSGAKAWLYPVPGKPTLLNLLKFIFYNDDDIYTDTEFNSTAHKRYVESISLFGKLHDIPIPMTGKKGQYKMYFLPAANTSLDDIQQRKITVRHIEGVDWRTIWNDRNHLI